MSAQGRTPTCLLAVGANALAPQLAHRAQTANAEPQSDDGVEANPWHRRQEIAHPQDMNLAKNEVGWELDTIADKRELSEEPMSGRGCFGPGD